MCLVTLRPVLCLREHLFSSITTDVRGYALALVKDLDGSWCRSNFHSFLHQGVGHAVEVGVEGDVVVGGAPARLPLDSAWPSLGRWG